MPKQPNVSKYAITTNPNENPSIQLFDRFAFENSSKIQAINVAHIVYHFQCHSFDATMYLQTS
jgi:hypothetical protein